MNALLQESTYNATARKIIDTAEHLFMQRGYSAVSINDIVKAAGVTKPTLYYYFPDKEELFVQMALHGLATLNADMEAAIAGHAEFSAMLTAVADVLLNDRDRDMRMMRHEMREHLSPAQQQRVSVAFYQRIFEPLRRVMQQGLDGGELGGYSAIDLALLFLGFMEAFHGQSRRSDWGKLTERLDTPFTPTLFSTETIVNVFLHGVSAKVQPVQHQ